MLRPNYTENRSYLVQTENGVIRRRNRRHIRPTRRKKPDIAHDVNYDDDQPENVEDDYDANPPADDAPSTSTATRTTRSGRTVKPPDRLIEH